jgi:predicted helicase
VYDRRAEHVVAKVKYLTEIYEDDRRRVPLDARGKRDVSELDTSIKWTRSVKRYLENDARLNLKGGKTIQCQYRPFDKQWLFFYPPLIEMLNLTRSMFGDQDDSKNLCLIFSDPTSQKPFMVTSTNIVYDMHLVGAASGAAGLSRFRFADTGERIDNITDWGLKQFQTHYEKGKRPRPKRKITKDSIFHYVYGVLHDPIYRETYAINLKREFPRIPFYPNFWRWADWGRRLLDLHIGYESVAPWKLKRSDKPDEGSVPKPTLKADKAGGTIVLDSRTTLSGIPPAAWNYRLGSRSSLEWVLDQYKEKKPKDATVAAKFNTYRFKDYKEQVIELLARVTRVSLETMEVIDAMREADRSVASNSTASNTTPEANPH